MQFAKYVRTDECIRRVKYEYSQRLYEQSSDVRSIPFSFLFWRHLLIAGSQESLNRRCLYNARTVKSGLSTRAHKKERGTLNTTQYSK